MARSTAKKSAKKAAPRKSSSKKSASASTSRRSGSRSSALGTRPIWQGNLRLALVQVPVKLYSATATGARISLHQVHEPSGKRIRYTKTVPGVGPVDADEIVKGFDLGKGRYVLLEPEEIDELKLEAKKTLDLVQFVEEGEIAPIWFDRPYYVVADGELAEEAYGVLRDALRGAKRVGLGQFVMRGREYVAAIKPCGRGLLLETLRFEDEVREAAPFFAEVEDIEPDQEMQDLARQLIERKTAAFDPGRFKDSYTAALRDLIDAKAKNKPVEIEEDEEPSGAEIIDLVEALKKSVRGGESGSRSPRGRRKAG
jgi:DNA end-binding protein Ku